MSKKERPGPIGDSIKLHYGPDQPVPMLSVSVYKGGIVVAVTPDREVVWLTAGDAESFAHTLLACAKRRREIDRWDLKHGNRYEKSLARLHLRRDQRKGRKA